MKTEFTEPETTFLVAIVLFFGGLLAKLWTMVDKQVPVGYQDETGFHYGEKR